MQRSRPNVNVVATVISPRSVVSEYRIQYNTIIQYNKNLFKHGKIVQYKRKQLKLIYKIAVWESLSI